MPRQSLLAFLFMSLFSSLANAEVKFASPFGDHMVLQRNQKICLWGQGDPNTTIDISVASQHSKVTVAADGKWLVYLAPGHAGGPYSLTAAADGKVTTISDVLVGDVWLCSGQSNMQMSLKECDDGPLVAGHAAEHPNLRLCRVGNAWTKDPQTEAKMKWTTATPATAGDFTAIGYYFADELLKDPARANVPIGIVESCLGGTLCEAWIPQSALTEFDSHDLHDSMFGIKPTTLYNGMIAPLGKLPMAGVIWYQGEGNAGQPQSYSRLLTTLMASWRKQFENPDLPFVIVELPDYATDWGGMFWSWLREAQQQAVTATPNSFLAISINTNDGYNLHPIQKHEIGRRIALLAREQIYKEKIVGHGPVFKSAKIEGPAIRITFDTDGDGLSNQPAGAIRGFTIAGEDGIYQNADAEMDGDTVVVSCASILSPKTVRYAWAGVPNSSLTNHSGLPAAPFRTDRFPIANLEMQRQPIGYAFTGTNYKIAISSDGTASLAIRNKQFLSNDLGDHAGINTSAGPLQTLKQLAPNQLSLSNDRLMVLMTFKPDSMQWSLINRSKADVHFRLSLTPTVRSTEPTANPKTTLSRAKASMQITGVDQLINSNEGSTLESTIKPSETRQTQFAIPN